jgi:hypothetical protein
VENVPEPQGCSGNDPTCPYRSGDLLGTYRTCVAQCMGNDNGNSCGATATVTTITTQAYKVVDASEPTCNGESTTNSMLIVGGSVGSCVVDGEPDIVTTTTCACACN